MAERDGGTPTADAAPSPAGTLPRRLRQAAELVTRLVELALVTVGLEFSFGGSDSWHDLGYLALWDLVALCYVTTGVLVMRRRRLIAADARADPAAPWLLRMLAGRRFTLMFTLAASLTGMSAAAVVVLDKPAGDLGTLLKFFAMLAMVLAWLLLHAGYARFYGATYFRRGAQGLRFPDTRVPSRTDLLYFALTLGTTFAVSDVSVTTSEMRWHVTVHSVVSFFYNAVVLALAIGILTGR